MKQYYFIIWGVKYGGQSCLVALGMAVPPWATETVLSPWLAADEVWVSLVLSHAVWWKIIWGEKYGPMIFNMKWKRANPIYFSTYMK